MTYKLRFFADFCLALTASQTLIKGSLDEKVADSDYFLHWLSSSEAKQRIKKSTQGSVRETVSFGDLGAIPIYLPELSVQ